MKGWMGLILVAALAGCGSHPPVPVVDGRSPLLVEGARGGQPGEAGRAGYYVVKKGDNLYRIAHMHGVSQADLIAWNGLADSTRISVGQQLRVKAVETDDVVQVRAVAAPDAIVVVGETPTDTPATPGLTVTGAATTPAAGVATAPLPPPTGTLMQEPKGGKVAYSDTALAEVRALEGGASGGATPTTNSATGSATNSAATGSATNSGRTPETAGDAAATTDGIDWTWPVAGKIIRGFGRDNSGELSRGIDVAGRKGQAIQSAADGKVSFVGSLKDYGDFVVIRHNEDYLSVYAHTDRILVKQSQVVRRGQKIAEVGSSGTDQTKLHFEIRYKSEPVDPLKLLPVRQ